MSVRANQVKMAKLIDMDRPGLAKPFMVPAKLKNQVRATPMTDLQFSSRGTGSEAQWRISVARPGLAQPLITAKQEQRAATAVVKAMENNKSAAPAADRAMVAVANAANQSAAAKPTGVAGFFAGLGSGLGLW